MSMRPFIALLIAALFPLGGCIQAPDLVSEDQVSVALLAHRVRCEIYFATKEYETTADTAVDSPKTLHDLVTNLAFSAELTLQVKDTDGIGVGAASSTWGIPVKFGLFSLKASGGLQGVGRRTATYKIMFSVEEVWKTKHEDCRAIDRDRPANIRLDGYFGIDEWLKRVFESTEKSNSIKQFSATGTTIEFVLTPSVGVTSSWAITRPSGRKFDGTTPLGLQREYLHKIDIASVFIGDIKLALRDKAPAKPQYVCVLNDSSPELCQKKLDDLLKKSSTIRDLTVSGADPRAGSGQPGIRERISPEAQRRLDEQLNNLRIQGLRLQ